MKKLTLIALVGIVLALGFLAIKESPAPVSAPKIKSSDASAAAQSASMKFLEKHPVPSQIVAARRPKQVVFQASETSMVNRRDIRRKLGSPQTPAVDRHVVAASAPLTKTAVVAAGEVKVPKAADSKWVSHLSGENVDLEIRRNDLSGTDCTQQICPDKASAYTLVGVVVQPQRVAQRNQRALDGQMATGDGQDRPFLYLK